MNKWMIWGYHYFWKHPYNKGLILRQYSWVYVTTCSFNNDIATFYSTEFQKSLCQNPCHSLVVPLTPPKTNMEPENGPLEKEIPIGNHHFQVPC